MRRTKAEVEAIKAESVSFLEDEHPATCRQVFYHCVVSGLIEKTENEYRHTICRLLAEMRRDGLNNGNGSAFSVPFDHIADNTRWMRKPQTYSKMKDALGMIAQFYRRALWDEQDTYIEVWLEKEALSGVLYEVTGTWDVPLMVTRGYPSLSFLYAAARTISEVRKPTVIYYLGDHDPSGEDIPRFTEHSLREFAPEAEIDFRRLAVTPEQIASMKLPTRPTKRSDPRAHGFEGRSVEVDAITPGVLRELVEAAIKSHVDARALDVTFAAEESERGFLTSLAEHYGEYGTQR